MARLLPEAFDFAHNLAFVMHDLMADHIVLGERERLLFFEVELHHAENATAMKGLEGEEFWHWCEQNGYRHVLDKYSHRQLIFGLLSDMCQFVYEGLKCSEKGKLSVAFSNFRKPLQDNLFFLEWILADWPGFLTRFRLGPAHFELNRLDKELKKTTRVELIAKAMEKTELGHWFEPEMLYELRYEKASDIGFDPIFNRALHLITTFKHYATEPENVNFIFCDDDDRNGLWHHLYSYLPVVLMHALQVVRALFHELAPEFEPHDSITDIWLSVGFLLWSEELGDEDDRDAAASVFNELLEEAPIGCPNCNEKLMVDTANMRSFWEAGTMTCRHCQHTIELIEMAKRQRDDGD